jgi:hypothetical protein
MPTSPTPSPAPAGEGRGEGAVATPSTSSRHRSTRPGAVQRFDVHAESRARLRAAGDVLERDHAGGGAMSDARGPRCALSCAGRGWEYFASPRCPRFAGAAAGARALGLDQREHRADRHLRAGLHDDLAQHAVLKISTSIAPLSVSTTATTSPRFTRLPGATCHSTIVPSSMSAPSAGSLNSLASLNNLRTAATMRAGDPAAPRPRDASDTGSALPRCTRARSARRGRRSPARRCAWRSRPRGCRCASLRPRSRRASSCAPTRGSSRRRAGAGCAGRRSRPRCRSAASSSAAATQRHRLAP